VGLYDEASHVSKLTSSAFPDSAATGGGAVWLVEFYAPWCVLTCEAQSLTLDVPSDTRSPPLTVTEGRKLGASLFWSCIYW